MNEKTLKAIGLMGVGIGLVVVGKNMARGGGASLGLTVAETAAVVALATYLVTRTA